MRQIVLVGVAADEGYAAQLETGRIRGYGEYQQYCTAWTVEPPTSLPKRLQTGDSHCCYRHTAPADHPRRTARFCRHTLQSSVRYEPRYRPRPASTRHQSSCYRALISHQEPISSLPGILRDSPHPSLCSGPSGRRTTAALASSSARSSSTTPTSTSTSTTSSSTRPRTRTNPASSAPVPSLFTSSTFPPAVPPPSYSAATGTHHSSNNTSDTHRPPAPSTLSPPPSPSFAETPIKPQHQPKTPLNSTPASTDQILLSRKRLDSAGQHPRVAALLGVKPRWYVPLLICRALSCAPAAWWGFRCALTFLGELILRHGRGLTVLEPGSGNISDGILGGGGGGGTGMAVGTRGPGWAEAERRFRVTEVFLAILWCSASAYLSFFFTDCLMTRWLVNYTPFATVMRLLTLNALIAYISSLSMWLSGASEDPRMLLPAWISIATLLTMIYHLTQRKINIRKETHASIHIFSFASFVSLCAVLFQLHLARENDPVVPLFEMAKQVWRYLHIGQDSTYGKSEL